MHRQYLAYDGYYADGSRAMTEYRRWYLVDDGKHVVGTWAMMIDRGRYFDYGTINHGLPGTWATTVNCWLVLQRYIGYG